MPTHTHTRTPHTHTPHTQSNIYHRKFRTQHQSRNQLQDAGNIVINYHKTMPENTFNTMACKLSITQPWPTSIITYPQAASIFHPTAALNQIK